MFTESRVLIAAFSQFDPRARRLPDEGHARAAMGVVMLQLAEQIKESPTRAATE
jgi:hypothetical protein